MNAAKGKGRKGVLKFFIEIVGVARVNKIINVLNVNSIIHHLSIILCVHHHLCPTFTSLALVITILLSVSMRGFCFLTLLTQPHNSELKYF